MHWASQAVILAGRYAVMTVTKGVTCCKAGEELQLLRE